MESRRHKLDDPVVDRPARSSRTELERAIGAGREELFRLIRQLPEDLRAEWMLSPLGRSAADGWSLLRLEEGYRHLLRLTADCRHEKIRELRCLARESRRRLRALRDRIILAHRRLVPGVLGELKLAPRHGFTDLVQEGYIGLLQAADRYVPQLGYRFSTYAVWWIRKTALSAAQRNRLIRLPAHVMVARRRLDRTLVDLERELGRSPDVGEIARAMGMTAAKVRKLLDIVPEPYALEEGPAAGASRTRHRSIQDPSVVNALEGMLRREARHGAREAIGQLAHRERAILRLRFGFEDDEERSLREIGREVNLSRERIRTITKQALEKIRRAESGLFARSRNAIPAGRPPRRAAGRESGGD